MNPLDDQLNRLFRAAAAAPRAEERPGYGLETRVLAAWRRPGTATTWDTGILVRGLVLASMIMGASLWTALDQKSNSDSDHLRLADSTMPADLP